MKKLISVLLCFLLFTSVFSISGFASRDISVTIDGKTIDFDVPPAMVNNRVLVPMRAIFEALGAYVSWDDESQMATGSANGVVVQLVIGEYTMLRNMVPISIDVPAQLINDRTLVPIRAVSEPFGLLVDWDEHNQQVIMTTQDTIRQLDWNKNFSYYGETENGEAKGYGALYEIKTGILSAMGYFNNGELTEGVSYYEDGSTDVGNFSDWLLHGEDGDRYLADGTHYKGTWEYGRIYNGEIFFPDNTYYKGDISDGIPHGYGTYINFNTGLAFTGNWVNGEESGEFIIDNLENGNSFHHTYPILSGQGIATTPLAPDYEGYQRDLLALENELQEAYQEYRDAMDELADYMMDGDPYQTDWAHSIMESFGVTEKQMRGDFSDLYTDGIDQYAAANAERQLREKVNAARQMILETDKSRIQQQKAIIEEKYASQKAQIQTLKDGLKQKYNIP